MFCNDCLFSRFEKCSLAFWLPIPPMTIFLLIKKSLNDMVGLPTWKIKSKNFALGWFRIFWDRMQPVSTLICIFYLKNIHLRSILSNRYFPDFCLKRLQMKDLSSIIDLWRLFARFMKFTCLKKSIKMIVCTYYGKIMAFRRISQLLLVKAYDYLIFSGQIYTD